MLDKIISELNSLKNPDKARILQWFFKTWKGEYWEWDKFLWISIPDLRQIAKKYFKDLDLNKVSKLLSSELHEFRIVALMILIEQFNKWDFYAKKQIYDFYLSNLKFVNNWDLVDLSSYKIVWEYLKINNDLNSRKILFNLAKSSILWEKRVAMISTFAFIKDRDFDLSLDIAEILINDKHDLIQKAVWWMLREIWKRDIQKEEEFLKKHFKTMPRTALRYAIERFDQSKRKKYL